MAPRKDAITAPSASQTQQDASSEGIEEFELPRTLVTQLARSALPEDVKLQDETITALVKGSTVFINYLTANAQEVAASRAHKTISGADVLKALEVLEFGDLVDAFQSDLDVFRQVHKTDKGKSKAVLDVKGKGKEKLSPSSSVKSTTASGIDINDAPELGEVDTTKSVNGASAADVEMRDVTEGVPPHDVDAVEPVTLPLE